VDFSKAFDLIDHNILLQKFKDYSFPAHLTVWSLEFLKDRQQFVKIGNDHSKCRVSNAGTPQGTISGPNDFKLLINDLSFELDYAKYVDDTTVLSVSSNPADNSLQLAANHLVDWTTHNHMIVNECKTKEMLIHFGSVDNNLVPSISINAIPIERVTTFKLLGVMISADLSWEAHVNYMLSKVAKRMYCIHYLVRAGVLAADIVLVYKSIIRSVLEYACPVWHPGLSAKQSEYIEKIQKRCLRVIYPSLSYTEALSLSGLDKLGTRRERLTKELLDEIKCESHILNSLSPKRNPKSLRTRNPYPYIIPITKQTRFGRAFVPYCISKRY